MIDIIVPDSEKLHSSEWEQARAAVDAAGYAMQTVADYKATLTVDDLDPVADASLIEAAKVLPGDDQRLRSDPGDPKQYPATRKSDGAEVILYGMRRDSHEVAVWTLLRSLPLSPPLLPVIHDGIETPSLFVVALDASCLTGTYIYPGGFETGAHVWRAHRFWFELHAFLHSHNIAVQCMDEWFCASNFHERTDPEYRPCYLYFHESRLLRSKEERLPVADAPAKSFRHAPAPPEWTAPAAAAGQTFDPFKSDMFCLGSFIRNDAKNRGTMTPELETLCNKLQMRSPDDRIDAAKALELFNSICDSA
ncbi:hypothetical protein DFJ73DRAFT_802481 [Zopfochytrium polystomum]|nr:hypothetical protein DFJ73DRAFT_802481 [Zopfochytrium polystomum]